MPLFSVILPTRNRPALFAEALASVLRQSCSSIEVIVIDDGSDDVHEAAYRQIVEAVERPVSFRVLARRPKGHGQSYAINVGVSLAKSDYVCFLDDDDSWTDDLYLDRVRIAIERSNDLPDLIFSSQAAFFHGQRKAGPIWLEGLADRLQQSGYPMAVDGFFRASVKDLMQTDSFCHLNTTVVRRNLFNTVGGMDESIRWECDRDLFLRLVDTAGTRLLSPYVVSRHNIPDPAQGASMTTMLGEIQRRLFQLQVCDKALLFASNPIIRTYGRRHRGYALKRIAETLVAHRDYRAGACYARTALGAAPSLKWLAFTIYVTLASLTSSKSDVGRRAQGRMK